MANDDLREWDARVSPIEKAFVQYERAIKRLIARITRSSDEVDDIAQEALFKSILAERRRPINDAKAYLFEAARNTALTERSRRIRSVLQMEEPASLEVYGDGRPSADEIAMSHERFSAFCEAVYQLPPQCRRALLMCKIHGKSHREIAHAMGISTSTVEKHIGTALSRCAAFMAAREEGEGPSLHHDAPARRRK